MAVKYLTDKNPDGTSLGQSAAEKVSLYGVTPVIQPAHADQAAVTAGATTTAANTLLIQLRLALIAVGAIKGGA